MRKFLVMFALVASVAVAVPRYTSVAQHMGVERAPGTAIPKDTIVTILVREEAVAQEMAAKFSEANPTHVVDGAAYVVIVRRVILVKGEELSGDTTYENTGYIEGNLEFVGVLDTLAGHYFYVDPVTGLVVLKADCINVVKTKARYVPKREVVVTTAEVVCPPGSSPIVPDPDGNPATLNCLQGPTQAVVLTNQPATCPAGSTLQVPDPDGNPATLNCVTAPTRVVLTSATETVVHDDHDDNLCSPLIRNPRAYRKCVEGTYGPGGPQVIDNSGKYAGILAGDRNNGNSAVDARSISITKDNGNYTEAPFSRYSPTEISYRWNNQSWQYWDGRSWVNTTNVTTRPGCRTCAHTCTRPCGHNGSCGGPSDTTGGQNPGGWNGPSDTTPGHNPWQVRPATTSGGPSDTSAPRWNGPSNTTGGQTQRINPWQVNNP